MATRPRLVAADTEMRRWCASLEEEVGTWPDVTSRPMFGMLAVYRAGAIFAALPRTKAAETPFSILLKLPGVRDERLKNGRGPGAKWSTFAMGSEEDMPAALELLGRAYERASPKLARKRPSGGGKR